jgi:hypothetical protein
MEEIETFTQLIECPECGTVQEGTVECTVPFGTYIHECKSCAYIIMESEWNVVTLKQGEVLWKNSKGQEVVITPDPNKIASMFYGRDHDRARDEYYTKLADQCPIGIKPIKK